MIPAYLKSYFPSYRLSDLDISEDKCLIITTLLNFGDIKAVEWLLDTYSSLDIVATIQAPLRGSWTKKSLNYWCLIYDIQLDEQLASMALMDVTPRPEIYSELFN
jgi:hypothetical protein